MMHFGTSLTNPLLQVAVSVGEATIRHACDEHSDLQLSVGLGQLPDGRDAICVFLETPQGKACFEMLLRNYFDRAILWRVARRAWLHLEPVLHRNFQISPSFAPALN